MRILFNLLFLVGLTCVIAKNNIKSLTESMGQEIIEIGGPGKDLPADLEEEPSAELDEDDKIVTTTTLGVATKKETKKTTPLVPERRKNKDYNKLDDDSKQEDEEMRIEKELAEIYKDNLDYKADSSEASSKVTLSGEAEEETKPIARARITNFKFQPDINNKAEVERFRTSVDEISCVKKAVKLDDPVTPEPNGAVILKKSDAVFFTLLASTFLRFSLL